MKETRIYITIQRRLSVNQSGTQKDLVFHERKKREQSLLVDYANPSARLRNTA